MIYYKVLNENGMPIYGTGKWDTSGEWMPRLSGELVPCSYGYHLCRKVDLVGWLGPAIWIAECSGQLVRCSDKVVCRQARLIERIATWNDRTARLFGADCAERALQRLESPDQRSIEAIAVARRFAEGEATKKQLAAAGAAARGAAWAARGAAWDAAWAATRAAGDAAGAAAWAAAGAAAWAAAGAAARDAEHNWQTARLFHYLNEGAGS